MNKFKEIFPLLALVLFLFITVATTQTTKTVADATQWGIDPAHSSIQFSVRHFFTPVSGSFGKYTSDIKFDPDNLTESSINISIDVSSINTGNQRRDNHLKSPDFFETANHPNIEFKSTRIRKAGDNTFIAEGNLTMRGTSKNIELPFTLLGIRDHPFQEGKKLAGITAQTKLNRSDYNIGVGDFATDAIVCKEVTVDIALEMVSK